jgi:hypothetical protein
MAVMRVDVSIGELVLVGIDPRERHQVADAVERELAGRLSASSAAGLAAGDATIDRVRADDVVVPHDAASRGPALATGIGRSLATAITRHGYPRYGGDAR